jgi:hypothetical protein
MTPAATTGPPMSHADSLQPFVIANDFTIQSSALTAVARDAGPPYREWPGAGVPKNGRPGQLHETDVLMDADSSPVRAPLPAGAVCSSRLAAGGSIMEPYWSRLERPQPPYLAGSGRGAPNSLLGSNTTRDG